MVKKQSVTVGIAAYNEGKNIKKILTDILCQKQDNWKLKEIIVYSDGSTDNTSSEVKKIRSSHISLITCKKRLGKAEGINQILARFNSDILVLFDADERIFKRSVISSIVKAFNNKKVVLAGGNTQPLKPKTFFQKAVYSTFNVFNESRKYVKNGNNIFGATGGCLALRQSFAKKLHLPPVLNDDDYIYFSAISKKHTFKYVEEAEVFYKLPVNLRDYLRQSFRSNPEAATINMSKYFGDLVKIEYRRPVFRYLKSIFSELQKNPLGTFYIALVNIFVKTTYPIFVKQYKLSNFTATSTK